MNGKTTGGSLGGVVLLLLLVSWFGGCEERDLTKSQAIGKILQPLAELIIETDYRWARIAGIVLRLVGTLLEVEYLFADGRVERTTRTLAEEQARGLKPGDRLILRDKDGVDREFELKEVGNRRRLPGADYQEVNRGTVQTPATIPCRVKYRCPVEFNQILPRSEARQLADLCNRLAVPCQGQDLNPTHSAVWYGPVFHWQEVVLPDSQQAQAVAIRLRNAGFEVFRY